MPRLQGMVLLRGGAGCPAYGVCYIHISTPKRRFWEIDLQQSNHEFLNPDLSGGCPYRNRRNVGVDFLAPMLDQGLVPAQNTASGVLRLVQFVKC